MVKAQVLEFFPDPEKSPDRRIRKERWSRLKVVYEPLGVVIDIPEPLLDDEGQKVGNQMVGMDGQPFSFEGYDVVFIHQSDADRYLDEAALKSQPVVCYGGGTEHLQIGRIAKLIIDFLPLHLLEVNLKFFFDKVAHDQTITLESFHVLIGFDPGLEAKLTLLHICLTPEGAKQAFNGQFPQELKAEKARFWNETLRLLNPSLNLDDQRKHLGDLTVASTTERLGEIGDCFSDEYIATLAALRGALLLA